METINFLDPDYKKKKKYNNNLKALINFHKNMTPTELAIVSEFFERKLLNQRTKTFENRTFLLNVAGSIRTLFRLYDYHKVEKDLKDLGINLTVPQKHLSKIHNEFKRRNRSRKQFSKNKSRGPVTVEYKRRR